LPEKALEAATWSALLKVPRGILAGDHLQLPPTVISEAAAKKVRDRFLLMASSALNAVRPDICNHASSLISPPQHQQHSDSCSTLQYWLCKQNVP